MTAEWRTPTHSLVLALYQALGDTQIHISYSDDTEEVYESVKKALDALDSIYNNIGPSFVTGIWAENPHTHRKVRLGASVRVHLAVDGIVEEG